MGYRAQSLNSETPTQIQGGGTHPPPNPIGFEHPVLPFLVFLEKGKESHRKNKDFSSLPNPQIHGKERKNVQKTRTSSRGKKTRNKKKGKEGQGRDDTLHEELQIVFAQTVFVVVGVCLAAQCEIPPHIAQYPFEIVSQRGYRTHLPCFIRYCASIAEIPLLRGGHRTSTLRICSPGGKRSEKGEGVSHPIAHVETPKIP